MASDTRNRILEAAIELFSRDGFAGTSIKDIADAVGIVKSALYRHFESKEEIWTAAYQRMAAYYAEHFGSVDNLPGIPHSMDELYDMTMRMVNFTVHDTDIVRMRKILLTEQFRDEKIGRLASDYFLYDTEAIFTKVFSGMMDEGILRSTDPKILALSYTAPITALIHLCDREPSKTDEAMEKAKAFIRHFTEEYGIKE